MAYFNDQGIHYTDGAQLDGFGRLRITPSLVSLFQSKQLFDANPLWWDDQQISGSGTSSTHSNFHASCTIAVSNTTAGRRMRQTKTRMPYQPGKSHSIRQTFLIGAGAVGITKRIGYYDDNDGIFLERKDNAVNLVVRSSSSGAPSDANSVAQASWNIDTFGASTLNPSLQTLDLSKVQLMCIDFAWLGVSRVRVGFVIAGQLYYAHQFLTSNLGATVFMSNPNLPLRYEVINGGTGPAASIEYICSAVDSEGGTQLPGLHLSADTGLVELVTLNSTALFPLICIRLDPTKQLASVIPHHVGVICTTNAEFRFALLLNPTFVGTALSWNSIANSAVQYATPTNATTVTAGTGTQFDSGFSPAGANQPMREDEVQNIPMGANIAGTSDILALVVQRITGTAEHFSGLIHWLEVI